MDVLSKLLFMRAVVVRLSLLTLMTLPVSACRHAATTPRYPQMVDIAGRLGGGVGSGGPVRWLRADPRTSGQVLADGSIVDITDPEQPRRIGWWPARAVPDGDRFYRLQQDSMSVSRWSPSGPGNELGRFPTGGAPVALDVYGGYAYVAHTVEGYLSNLEDESGLVQASLEWIQIIDATHPSAMREVGRIAGIGSKVPELQWGRPSRIRKGDACGWGGGPWFKRRVGIVKVGAAGLFLGIGPSLRRYDISDPSKPRWVAEVDLDGAVVDMVLEDEWLAVSHMELDSRNQATSAITVVDISDTESLDVIDELAVSDDSCGPLLAAEGRRLAAAAGLRYHLYEVAKPVKPLMEWIMRANDATDGFADMALIGDVLVLAGADQGLITMRIPDNATPTTRPLRDLDRPPP